jgi:hypothetical protein
LARTEPWIQLFAIVPNEPLARTLEERLMRFLKSADGAESLDEPPLAQQFGSNTKADFLLARRRIVAEVKTINGDPTPRIEQRLKKRMAQPGAPLGYGRFGMESLTNALPDGQELLKTIHDLSARAVRRHLVKADEQIEATKSQLSIKHAAGLAVIANDSEALIDVASIGYAFRNALAPQGTSYPHIRYAWISVEAHRIRLPTGKLGYPQLLVLRTVEHVAELHFLLRMMEAWASANDAKLEHIEHHGNWDAMRAVYHGEPPVLAAYE